MCSWDIYKFRSINLVAFHILVINQGLDPLLYLDRLCTKVVDRCHDLLYDVIDMHDFSRLHLHHNVRLDNGISLSDDAWVLAACLIFLLLLFAFHGYHVDADVVVVEHFVEADLFLGVESRLSYLFVQDFELGVAQLK